MEMGTMEVGTAEVGTMEMGAMEMGAMEMGAMEMGTETRCFRRYVAIGDSFTEGVGDELADGSVRGWADLVAGLAAESYANLAVRGKLLGPIIDEQLDAALLLRPDLVSFAGGGNDVLRPRADMVALGRLLDLAVARLSDTGATVVMFTGADPSDQLPFGQVVRRHGDAFYTVAHEIAARRGAVLVDLWPVSELRDARYWSEDKLHLNPAGHRQVAARVLDRLHIDRPAEWTDPVAPLPLSTAPVRERVVYYRQYVGPSVQRRLSGRSSGDDRQPKRPGLIPIG